MFACCGSRGTKLSLDIYPRTVTPPWPGLYIKRTVSIVTLAHIWASGARRRWALAVQLWRPAPRRSACLARAACSPPWGSPSRSVNGRPGAVGFHPEKPVWVCIWGAEWLYQGPEVTRPASWRRWGGIPVGHVPRLPARFPALFGG